MGRHRQNDRDELLDAAENIVQEGGAAALTIEALAKAMGISKGGVQYAFGSKDDLVSALVDRATQRYDEAFALLAGDHPLPREALYAHIDAMRQSQLLPQSKATALLLQLLQTPEHLASTRQWYRHSLGRVVGDDPGGRERRLTYLATEGLFFLRFLGLMEFSDAEVSEIFDDLHAQAQTETGHKSS